MTADGSMAVWGKYKTDAEKEASVEVHFNYWRIADAKIPKTPAAKETPGISGKDFVEVGVFLKRAAQVEELKIYLPGAADNWRLEDCGGRFKEPDIAQGIFNQQLSSHLLPGPERIDLLEPTNGKFCRVHIFPASNGTIDPSQLAQTPSNNGLLLTITREAINEACYQNPEEAPVYFRIRAYYVGKNKNPFVKMIKPPDRWFQTGYSVVEYLDFRLNEVRSLPRDIETLMRNGGDTVVPTILVAFLTAVPVQSDVTTISWDKAHKKRVLEDDLWAAYVPTGIPSGMTVYHWKEEATPDKPAIKDFSGFVKMQTRLVSRWLLITSFVIAFAFGIAGNLVASWLWDRASSPPARQAPQISDQHTPNLSSANKSSLEPDSLHTNQTEPQPILRPK